MLVPRFDVDAMSHHSDAGDASDSHIALPSLSLDSHEADNGITHVYMKAKADLHTADPKDDELVGLGRSQADWNAPWEKRHKKKTNTAPVGDRVFSKHGSLKVTPNERWSARSRSSPDKSKNLDLGTGGLATLRSYNVSPTSPRSPPPPTNSPTEQVLYRPVRREPILAKKITSNLYDLLDSTRPASTQPTTTKRVIDDAPIEIQQLKSENADLTRKLYERSKSQNEAIQLKNENANLKHNLSEQLKSQYVVIQQLKNEKADLKRKLIEQLKTQEQVVQELKNENASLRLSNAQKIADSNDKLTQVLTSLNTQARTPASRQSNPEDIMKIRDSIFGTLREDFPKLTSIFNPDAETVTEGARNPKDGTSQATNHLSDKHATVDFAELHKRCDELATRFDTLSEEFGKGKDDLKAENETLKAQMTALVGEQKSGRDELRAENENLKAQTETAVKAQKLDKEETNDSIEAMKRELYNVRARLFLSENDSHEVKMTLLDAVRKIESLEQAATTENTGIGPAPASTAEESRERSTQDSAHARLLESLRHQTLPRSQATARMNNGAASGSSPLRMGNRSLPPRTTSTEQDAASSSGHQA